MIRIWFVVFAPLLVGCADQSEGSALNACRMRYYELKRDPAAVGIQLHAGKVIPIGLRLQSQSDIAELGSGSWGNRISESAMLSARGRGPMDGNTVVSDMRGRIHSL